MITMYAVLLVESYDEYSRSSSWEAVGAANTNAPLYPGSLGSRRRRRGARRARPERPREAQRARSASKMEQEAHRKNAREAAVAAIATQFSSMLGSMRARIPQSSEITGLRLRTLCLRGARWCFLSRPDSRTQPQARADRWLKPPTLRIPLF